MKSFQDKLCDVLTFIGLVAVIAGGIYSLTSEKNEAAKTPEENSVLPAEQPNDQNPVALDTLEEIQLREDTPSVAPTKKDTLPKDSLLAEQPTTPSHPEDSAVHKDTVHKDTLHVRPRPQARPKKQPSTAEPHAAPKDSTLKMI